MPVIARFYGIVIKLFFSDHNPPHFHAIYNESNALYHIETGEVIEWDLPIRAHKLVQEWAKLHISELMEMWNSQELHQLPPLS